MKRNVTWLALGALFVFFILFRVFYQKGGKLLANLYPWNWVALVVILALLGFYVLKATRRKENGDR